MAAASPAFGAAPSASRAGHRPATGGRTGFAFGASARTAFALVSHAMPTSPAADPHTIARTRSKPVA